MTGSVDQLVFAAWRKKAPSKRKVLRDLMADGQWHPSTELVKISHRFGGLIFDLHRSKDGETPLHYRKRGDEGADSTRVDYQQAPESECDVCLAGKERPSEVIERLRKRVAELEAELVRLREGRW